MQHWNKCVPGVRTEPPAVSEPVDGGTPDRKEGMKMFEALGPLSTNIGRPPGPAGTSTAATRLHSGTGVTGFPDSTLRRPIIPPPKPATCVKVWNSPPRLAITSVSPVLNSTSSSENFQ